jgi:isopentenyl diphosphate isomerase/L-lactate dehydrogenase-like FMN-dependent dehydrogenase
MGVVEQSRGTVESQLSVLEDAYDSFSINQRTVVVPTAQYERKHAASASNEVEIHTKVTNAESDVLHIQTDGTATLPSLTAPVGSDLEAKVRAAVVETGIECDVDGVAGATMLGIRDRNDAEREPLYRLAVLFEAHRQAGSINDNAIWKQYEPETHPIYI